MKKILILVIFLLMVSSVSGSMLPLRCTFPDGLDCWGQEILVSDDPSKLDVNFIIKNYNNDPIKEIAFKVLAEEGVSEEHPCSISKDFVEPLGEFSVSCTNIPGNFPPKGDYQKLVLEASYIEEGKLYYDTLRGEILETINKEEIERNAKNQLIFIFILFAIVLYLLRNKISNILHKYYASSISLSMVFFTILFAFVLGLFGKLPLSLRILRELFLFAIFPSIALVFAVKACIAKEKSSILLLVALVVYFFIIRTVYLSW